MQPALIFNPATLLLVVLSGLFVGSFVEINMSSSEHYIHHLFDLLHFPGFILLSCSIAFFLLRSFSLDKAIVLSFFICVFLGGATETLQPYVGREKSLSDFCVNMLGSSIGLSFFYFFKSSASHNFRVLTLFFSLLGVLIIIYPTWSSIGVLREKRAEFPVFATNSEFSHRWWIPINNSSRVTYSAKGVGIESKGENYAGVVYEALGQDWSPYETLKLIVHSKHKAAFLGIRIDDGEDCKKYSNRFNTRIELKLGWNEIFLKLDDVRQGPLSRELQLNRISYLYLFIDPDPDFGQFLVAQAELMKN